MIIQLTVSALIIFVISPLSYHLAHHSLQIIIKQGSVSYKGIFVVTRQNYLGPNPNELRSARDLSVVTAFFNMVCNKIDYKELH